MSVDKRTKAILKARANRLYGGNMSQLITELGREAERRDAFDRMREWVGGSVLTEESVERIDRELEEGWKLARKHAKKTGAKSAA